MAVQTYNPADVKVIIAGYVVSGFADGTAISIIQNEPMQYDAHVGIQGEVSRTKKNNKTALLKFTLKHTAPFNTQMELINNTINAAKFPVSIQNKSDLQYKGGGAECWIQKMPDDEFGDTEQMQEYEVFISDYSKKRG